MAVSRLVLLGSGWDAFSMAFGHDISACIYCIMALLRRYEEEIGNKAYHEIWKRVRSLGVTSDLRLHGQTSYLQSMRHVLSYRRNHDEYLFRLMLTALSPCGCPQPRPAPYICRLSAATSPCGRTQENCVGVISGCSSQDMSFVRLLIVICTLGTS